MLHIGQFQIDRLADIDVVRLPSSRGFPLLTRDILTEHARIMGPRFIDPETLDLFISFHTYVLRINGRVILVDSCIGDHKHRPNRPDWHLRQSDFLQRLAGLGVQAEDVDAVMCTHMHADHVGWNTRLVNGQWVPTFPNARYIMAEVEYRHWQARYDKEGASLNHGSFADSVLPVVKSGQADMVGMSQQIEHGIHLEPAAGHTPGTVLIHVEDGADHGVLTGDIIHHPIQLAFPDMPSKYCEDPEQSAKVRVALCERYAGTQSRLLTAHFPAPSSGRILREGRHFGFEYDSYDT
jgi:glyoxylase-like metal-dependent hydrolase (beta-lactamase superfamily II)